MISLFYIIMLVILIVNPISCQSFNHLYPFISDKFYINGKNIRFIGIPYYTHVKNNGDSNNYIKIMKHQIEEPYLTESKNESSSNKLKVAIQKKNPFERIGIYSNADGYFRQLYFNKHTGDFQNFREDNNQVKSANQLADSLKLPENLKLTSQSNSQTKTNNLQINSKLSSIFKESISPDIDYIVRLPFQEN